MRLQFRGSSVLQTFPQSCIAGENEDAYGPEPCMPVQLRQTMVFVQAMAVTSALHRGWATTGSYDDELRRASHVFKAWSRNGSLDIVMPLSVDIFLVQVQFCHIA